MRRNVHNEGHEFKHDSLHQSERRLGPKINSREHSVHIDEFVNNHAGFTCVVNSHFSDLQINEIDLSGQVLYLTDVTVPKEQVLEEQAPKEQVEEEISGEALDAAKAELQTWVPKEKWAELVKLDETNGDNKGTAPVEINVSEINRESRKKIHELFKKVFGGRIFASTVVDKDDVSKKAIRITKQPPECDRDRRWTYPGKFLQFLVHKTNWNTTDVAATIATALNLRLSQVNYSGRRDKRAVTTQKFAIKRCRPEQILSAVIGMRDVHVGNFEFSHKAIKMGDSKGNRFRIALRHIDDEQNKIEQALEQVREKGFINYYGLQRFGDSVDVPNHEVGAALLKRDYKLAVELILMPRENDTEFLREILKSWGKTRDSAAAASKLRSYRSVQKKLLSGLAEYGEENYATALKKLPYHMLNLYPAAFLSFIFNKVASRRIKEFGLKVIVGDLVYRGKNEVDVERTAEEGTAEQASTKTDKSDKVEIENVTEPLKKNENKESTEKESILKGKVKALTQEDIDTNAYSVFDVVLPLPDFNITYPKNAVGEWYEEFLGEHGFSLEQLHHEVKTLSMPGSYRKLFIKPTEMSWKFVNYNQPGDKLIASDWEVLNQQQVETNVKDGKLRAVLLDFRLPGASYATMLLRELLKKDTSTARQTQLENQERHKMSN